jgi:hypothetical protein
MWRLSPRSSPSGSEDDDDDDDDDDEEGSHDVITDTANQNDQKRSRADVGYRA